MTAQSTESMIDVDAKIESELNEKPWGRCVITAGPGRCVGFPQWGWTTDSRGTLPRACFAELGGTGTILNHLPVPRTQVGRQRLLDADIAIIARYGWHVVSDTTTGDTRRVEMVGPRE